MNIPKIRIIYGKFLDPIFKGWFSSQPNFKDRIIPEKEYVDNQILMYKEQWNLYGDKILKSLCEITGLNFERNIIDVFVVSDVYRPFSRPLVITSKYKKDAFINFMIHELVHCLFSDNELSGKGDYPHPKKEVSKHVVVHALMEYILVNVLNLPEYLLADKNNCNKFPELGYKEAWGIVEREGYINLIEKFKLDIK